MEAETAWVFTPLERRIVRDEARDVTTVTDETGTTSETDRDHLSVLLDYFGIASPTGYFAPHTSKFDWDGFLIHKTG